MGRKQVEHACEGCGTIRLVWPDKLARGHQRRCRKCQGPAAAEKRRAAMLKRGGPKHVTFGICRECRNDYQMEPIDDDGFCCEVCRRKATKRGASTSDLRRLALFGLSSYPRLPPRTSWEQISLL